MDLKEELANEYALRYIKKVKILLPYIKEKGWGEKELREDLKKLAELSTYAFQGYQRTNNLAHLDKAISYLAYLEATLDFLEIQKKKGYQR